MNSYIAGGEEFHYPGAGDPMPERSDAKVLLLTKGGICVPGWWTGDPFYIAWKELPKRNREKEARLGQTAEARARDPEAAA